MKLVIIESASKSKKLKKILDTLYGKGIYKVTASLGHIRDLPKDDLGVDVDNGFRPRYVTSDGKGKVIKKLASDVADADEVYLAADPDREGEAIAWHIMQVTRPKVKVHRVTFNEITKAGIKRGFDNPETLNMDLVAAQEARRILDRLVGYKVSPALWRGLDEARLSAGRVQSVALKLVVERQHEIETFEPREYWSITAQFGVPTGEFAAKLVGWKGKQWTRDTFQSEAQAQAAISHLSQSLFQIKKLEIKERNRSPFAPFMTSTLQQAASSHLKLSPDKTMSIAQSLYEAGHITYMRTDSPAVSEEAADMAEDYIRERFGDFYVPEARRKFKAKGSSQEAHECIRPTDLYADDLSRELEGHALSLYKLIWERFIASQMADAVYDRITIYVQGKDALFMARSEKLQFDGFLQVYDYGEDVTPDSADDEDTANAKPLPAVTEQQTCRALGFTPDQHYTRPPATFSEASLVRELEARGIGRPSTFSMMVTTIRQRKYVEVKKRRLRPTALGVRVSGFLDENFALVVDPDFTKLMELSLDKIASGQLDTRQFLGAFWGKFYPLVEPWEYATPKKTAEAKPTGETCPVCGKGQIEIKTGKKGRFLGCSRYPSCRYSRDIKFPAPVLVGRKCPKCDSQLCVRSKRGSDDKFVGCTNYPHCKHSESFKTGTTRETV
ncbi:MAG: type I DNA topoisomerase [Chloroflexota bacterium]